MAEEWTGAAALRALAPALRACLAGDAAAFATAAEPLPEEGRVRVLVRRRDGRAEECVARLPDGEVLDRRPRPDLSPPDAAAPAFFLGRRCVDARRIDGPEGEVLGWLAYPGC